MNSHGDEKADLHGSPRGTHHLSWNPSKGVRHVLYHRYPLTGQKVRGRVRCYLSGDAGPDQEDAHIERRFKGNPWI